MVLFCKTGMQDMNRSGKRVVWLAAAGVLLALAAWIQPYELIRVTGGSMMPTYRDGQLLVGVKAFWLRGEPFRRGEVVMCRVGGEKLLKRIYALPGDEVVIFSLDDGFHVMVQAENYLRYYQLAEGIGHARISRFEVPEHGLFLLGDAPNVSLDSRDFGPVPEADVIARIR